MQSINGYSPIRQDRPSSPYSSVRGSLQNKPCERCGCPNACKNIPKAPANWRSFGAQGAADRAGPSRGFAQVPAKGPFSWVLENCFPRPAARPPEKPPTPLIPFSAQGYRQNLGGRSGPDQGEVASTLSKGKRDASTMTGLGGASSPANRADKSLPSASPSSTVSKSRGTQTDLPASAAAAPTPQKPAALPPKPISFRTGERQSVLKRPGQASKILRTQIFMPSSAPPAQTTTASMPSAAEGSASNTLRKAPQSTVVRGTQNLSIIGTKVDEPATATLGLPSPPQAASESVLETTPHADWETASTAASESDLMHSRSLDEPITARKLADPMPQTQGMRKTAEPLGTKQAEAQQEVLQVQIQPKEAQSPKNHPFRRSDALVSAERAGSSGSLDETLEATQALRAAWNKDPVSGGGLRPGVKQEKVGSSGSLDETLEATQALRAAWNKDPVSGGGLRPGVKQEKVGPSGSLDETLEATQALRAAWNKDPVSGGGLRPGVKQEKVGSSGSLDETLEATQALRAEWHQDPVSTSAPVDLFSDKNLEKAQSKWSRAAEFLGRERVMLGGIGTALVGAGLMALGEILRNASSTSESTEVGESADFDAVTQAWQSQYDIAYGEVCDQMLEDARSEPSMFVSVDPQNSGYIYTLTPEGEAAAAELAHAKVGEPPVETVPQEMTIQTESRDHEALGTGLLWAGAGVTGAGIGIATASGVKKHQQKKAEKAAAVATGVPTSPAGQLPKDLGKLA